MMSFDLKPITKLFLRLGLFTGVVLSIAYLPQIALAQSPQNDPAKAADILVQVNAWRIESGLWPLTDNPTLDVLAAAQASFIFPNVLTIDDESLFHLDAKL